MAEGTIRVQLIGDEELKRKLVSSRADVPVNRFLDRAASHLQKGARKKAPVGVSGRLRNSIGTETPNDRVRSVGPSVDYGEWVEKGTDPHYPPFQALWPWAKAKGVNPWALQQSIGMWGTEPHPYMEPAAAETETFIVTIVPVLAAEIESAFQ